VRGGVMYGVTPPPSTAARARLPSTGAWLTLAALAGCQQQETSLVIDVSGFFARPQILFAQLIDANGARPAVHQAGTLTEPVVLPATVYIQGSDKGSLLGAVVWLNDKAGSILAYAATERCIQTIPHKQTRASLSLGRPPNGWTPAQVTNCRCYREPSIAACPPPQGVPPPMASFDAAPEVIPTDARDARD
jgi:hypothetical protein